MRKRDTVLSDCVVCNNMKALDITQNEGKSTLTTKTQYGGTSHRVALPQVISSLHQHYTN